MTLASVCGTTRIAGVVGHPVTQSLSPFIHNAWLRALGLDCLYVAFPLELDGFAHFVGALRSGAVIGVNVTVPFKQQALQAAGTGASTAALAAGAANVLWRTEDGQLQGDNTDGEGLLYALHRQSRFEATRDPVVILGAGGASRGAIAALQVAGCTDIRIVNRTADRASELARDFGVTGYAFEAVQKALDGAGCVINATSAGLSDHTLPVLDFGVMTSHPVAMDMTYKPLITPFLAQAQKAGLQIVDGLEMLIGQARPSFAHFFGQVPPTSEELDIRSRLLDHLGGGV